MVVLYYVYYVVVLLLMLYVFICCVGLHCHMFVFAGAAYRLNSAQKDSIELQLS